MNSQVVLLFPFDLGLELDFSGKGAQGIVHEISTHTLTNLSFGGNLFADARAESHIYRFGVGIIQIFFNIPFDLPESAEMACNAEKIMIGKTSIIEWCQSRATHLIEKAQEFAIHRYDLRLKASDLFPIFI